MFRTTIGAILLLCTSLVASAQSAPSEKEEMLRQFNEFQELLRTKDVIRLSQGFINVNDIPDLLLGEHNPEYCNAYIDLEAKEISDEVLLNCQQNIFDHFNDLLLLDTIAIAKLPQTVIYNPAQEVCQKTITINFSNAFAESQVFYNVPPEHQGFIIETESDFNENNPETEEYECAGLSRYYFEFLDGKLRFWRFSSLP